MAIENLKFVRLKHKVKLKYRILSGIIAGISIPILLIVLFFVRPLPWDEILLIILTQLIFLPVAITGRALKWFEYINKRF